MKIKIASKLGSDAIAGLAPHANEFYDDMSTRAFGIVELAVNDRREPAPDNETADSEVKLRIAGLELAPEAQAIAVRRAMYALRASRTSEGTLTEGSDVQNAGKALRGLADDINATEVEVLRAALTEVKSKLAAALVINNPTTFELLEEISGALETIKAANPGVGLGFEE